MPHSVDGTPVALGHQGRELTGVVDVGVGQQDGVQLPGGDGQVAVFVDIRALLHAAVDQNALSGGLQQGTRAGDLVGRA